VEFFEGDSENLMNNEHLKDTEFDLIINVESSHCYGNFKVNDLKIPLIL
jgi:hypothetical protein